MLHRFALASILIIVSQVHAARKTASSLGHVEYEDFLRSHEHLHTSSRDSTVSLVERRALYEATRARVHEQNSKPNASWVAKIYHFADYTDKERQHFLGYKKTERRKASLLQKASSFIDQSQIKVAASVDWRGELKSSAFERNQGDCGSCWAVAAVGALEMHAELSNSGGKPVRLSHKQLVDCVPNTKHCGGVGGCQGATSELAFEYVTKTGLIAEDTYLGMGRGNGDVDQSCAILGKKPSASATSWVQLPANEYKPLLQAVNNGPVVVSIDATSFFDYDSGVLDGCKSPDAVVNHAVIVTGYGKDKDKPYWLIRNSWGSAWGEKGYLRVLRHEKERAYCGTDKKPKDGVGCDGGPDELEVCGMCGVLSDSSYPTGAKFIDPPSNSKPSAHTD